MNYLGREEAGLGALVGQWGQSLLSQAATSQVFSGVQPSPKPSFISTSSAPPARLQLMLSPPVIRKLLLIPSLKLFVAG